ncbi:hypothetical protein [Thiohalomonas denitrificans]|uniref:hypothetical protein n=1 Tax=Thiohalomonas denitrificans TaxID=415747 RepID=UPI0026E9500B|nr:hypothetical protein [Thiohalomonas denitrificans]
MSEKRILLMKAATRSDGFDQRLHKALEELGCDVAECDAADASRALDLLGENRLPVVLK